MSIAFIHADLDDAGLTPDEFRIYCRIRRRAGADGDCYESIPSMMEACQISVRPFRAAIGELLRRNMINRIDRAGKSYVFRVTPIESWEAPVQKDPSPIEPQSKKTLVQKDPSPKGSGTLYQKDQAPCTKRPNEVYPLKLIPLSESLSGERPENLDDQKKPRKVKSDGTHLPMDWHPSHDDRQFALALGLTAASVDKLALDFVDYWANGDGSAKTKKSWSLTWKNRVKDRLDVMLDRQRKTLPTTNNLRHPDGHPNGWVPGMM